MFDLSLSAFKTMLEFIDIKILIIHEPLPESFESLSQGYQILTDAQHHLSSGYAYYYNLLRAFELHLYSSSHYRQTKSQL